MNKVVTSSIGKKLLRDYVSPDGHAFFMLLKAIVVKQHESVAKGDAFEALVYKVRGMCNTRR